MNNKNKILVGCLALLLVLSVGYALFSDTITINGTASAKGSFDMTVTCETGISSKLGTASSLNIPSEGGYENDTCLVTDDIVDVSVGLLYPSAKRYFTIKITNSGTIDAVADSAKILDSKGQMCIANNMEGTDPTCVDVSITTGSSSGPNYFESAMYTIKSPSPFFEYEDGTLAQTEEQMAEFVDPQTGLITLKPGQSAYILLQGYFDEIYNAYKEFYINSDITIEALFNQKTTN